MPAVTPAEVETLPSRTKIGSRSTRAVGYRCWSASHTAQWVVARRPSSSPASPSRKAPLQTEVTRRARSAVRRIQDTRRASRMAARVPWPPAISSVSTGPVAWRRLRPATNASPLEVGTAPASGASTEIS